MTESHRDMSRGWWFLGGGVVLALSIAVSLTLGAFTIAPSDVAAWALPGWSDAQNPAIDRILSSIRLPRVLGAAALGAALAAGAAVLQGVYRTPLADGHLLGFSSAAGVGAAAGFGLSPTGAVPLLPVLFAAAAGAAYGAFASVLRSRVSGDRFILAGVAFGFAFLAWTGLFVLVVDSPRIPTLIFFVFGTLVGTTWKVLVTTSIVLYAGVAILWIVGPSIDLLVLGDRQARHVGLDTRRLVPVVIGTVGIVIGASVVLGGVVGFVGLVVPFLLRPLIGPALRILIPGSMLGGALAVVVADTVARTVAAPAEIPLGLITAAVGGPFLAWLLLRRSPA